MLKVYYDLCTINRRVKQLKAAFTTIKAALITVALAKLNKQQRSKPHVHSSSPHMHTQYFRFIFISSNHHQPWMLNKSSNRNNNNNNNRNKTTPPHQQNLPPMNRSNNNNNTSSNSYKHSQGTCREQLGQNWIRYVGMSLTVRMVITRMVYNVFKAGYIWLTWLGLVKIVAWVYSRAMLDGRCTKSIK